MTDTTLGAEQNSQQQNLSLLKIYTAYRVILAIALLAVFLLEPYQNILVGRLKPELFFYATCAYLLINIVALMIVFPRSRQLNEQQLFLNFFIDIIALTFIVDASGGINSGVAMLLVVTVAAASIMLRGQLSMLIAALASIVILADTFSLIYQNQLSATSFLPTGLLGIVLFITNYFIHSLSIRIRGAQLIAEQRAEDVSKLEQLNQQIVQRMRTGIIVCDPTGNIHLANAAASELLNTKKLQADDINDSSQTLPAILMPLFKQWQLTPRFHPPPFRVTETGPEINASFSRIRQNKSSDILVFLEDNRRLSQRAQQMKLASLGRLTASIAHEIRNPLSAISHASQLLNESEHLDSADHRLCDIIENHSERMNKVIENVLQLSRRNAPNPEKINLTPWVQQFADEFEYAGNNGTRFTIDVNASEDNIQTTVDTSQLNQIMTNLTQNGLRHSEKRTGSATLTLFVHRNNNTELPILDIIDDGEGINDESLQHIFEPFYTTDPKGSGLGLYISRELCEANESRLDYIRTEEGKSCFRISFPHPDRRLQPE